MSEKYPGGFVTYNPPTPSQTSATGIWTLSQQEQYQQAGLWPNSPSQVSRSLRFNSADSTLLSRTPAVAGNRRTWTFSAWVKRSKLNSGNAILATVSGSALNYFSFGTSSGDWLQYAYFDGATDVFNVNTSGTSVFRDVSAWYHIVLFVDTTQATAANRVKIYVNNVQQTLGGTYPTQNYDTPVNNSIPNYIGGATGSYTAYLSNQYMANIQFVDGQALDPTSFGEYNVNTGVWQPLQKNLTYGTNGFQLTFNDNTNTTATTLGADSSGNGNNWTPSNFSVTTGPNNDSMVDSPTSYGTDTGVGGEVRGNYSTFNPVGGGGGTLTNGNLDLSTTVTTPAVGTIAMTTGKWYWEVTNNTVANPRIGVYNIGAASPTNLGATANGWCLLNSPSRTFNNGSAPAYGSYSPTTGTVVMVAYDADAGKLWFGQDGTWFASGNPATGANASMTSVTGSAIVPAIANGAGTDTFSANFGQRPFAYTAPSGFKALCTQNLPTPTIGATTATQAGKYFNTVLYTGTGSSLSVTGVGFQPDLVWGKSRSTAYNHGLLDSVRGISRWLGSNTTQAEDYTAGAYVTAFNSDGFTAGAGGVFNNTSDTYVAWNWRAGNNAGSSNTAGSITSTVSANTTSGFSVVTYTGTNANATVGHGLGVTPSMIIVKQRNSAIENWLTYHSSLTSPTTSFLYLNSTDARQTVASYWNGGPTSTVFGIGAYSGINASAGTYVAYCFAPIAGYSVMGSYTGNGSTDGPFIYTGMKPAFVIVKNVSDAGVNWLMFDTTINTNNVVTTYLLPNSTAVQQTDLTLDILSNGFKPRIAGGTGINQNGSSYIYMAFASNPFKYSLAR